MEPVIRNFRNLFTPEGPSARLVWLDDNPPTCTMTYSEINPDQTSAHHIHPWEHEVYIIKGAGTLICDGKDYPVKEGDAILIPGDVDHYTLNNGGQGAIRRIEINPLMAAQQGGARTNGGMGSGKPPMIRNFRDLNSDTGSRIIGSKDGAPTYLMLYNGAMAPGSVSHPDGGGHIHPWEHVVFILEGHATIFCEGKEYPVSEGDGILVPPNTFHQWRNNSQHPMTRVTFNPLASEAAEH
ncbi:MAG: cupin domain-containing protein [Chloroflexi bacterium]|nr:cupin domain-containing protein [Chloroflexota bacterium]MCI0786396.1 cupin domain-containing protein [Chloroflexota bacterium]MCI0792853.1 cupin domain-containing protein [Chloroflexota bacterium]MCI0894090.1 cupin domain-containing protein [Chloroflexota bacterium]